MVWLFSLLPVQVPTRMLWKLSGNNLRCQQDSQQGRGVESLQQGYPIYQKLYRSLKDDFATIQELVNS